MMKRIMSMTFGLCVASVAGAANDPDTTGRTVKYLDTMNTMVVSYHTTNMPCFQYSPTVPPPTAPITCVPLTGLPTALQTLPVTSIGDIAVAANDSRSLLTLNLTSVADYASTNTGTARGYLMVNTQIKVTIESSVLNDPTLINSRTGQPFNGKFEGTYQWIFDQRSADVGEGFAVATRMPFDATLLSRKMLTSVGLSSTRAALVFARPMTVKLSVTGNYLGSGRANFHMHGRLMGD